MVDNDIYGSKELYHKIIQEIELFTQPESKKKKHGRRREYYVKNPANLIYFKQLFKIFEMKDISYIHRLRLVRKLLLTTYATEKDLKDCCREDINSVVAFMHNTHSSPKSKRDFIVDLKYLWKMILPHKDEHGEPSDTILPYVVRHLSTKIEKSKESAGCRRRPRPRAP